jgi:hypothetical protein
LFMTWHDTTRHDVIHNSKGVTCHKNRCHWDTSLFSHEISWTDSFFFLLLTDTKWCRLRRVSAGRPFGWTNHQYVITVHTSLCYCHSMLATFLVLSLYS